MCCIMKPQNSRIYCPLKISQLNKSTGGSNFNIQSDLLRSIEMITYRIVSYPSWCPQNFVLLNNISGNHTAHAGSGVAWHGPSRATARPRPGLRHLAALGKSKIGGPSTSVLPRILVKRKCIWKPICVGCICFLNTIFVLNHMYPENPKGTQVI